MFLLTIPVGSLGQGDTIEVEIKFRDAPFEDFVRSVEARYPVRFFYKSNWVSNIVITETTGQQTLGSILERALEDHGLFYHAGESGSIIITSREPVLSLSADFLSTEGELSDLANGGEVRPGETSVSEFQGGGNGQVIHINGGDGVDAYGFTLAGNVREAASGEPVIGAVVYAEDLDRGVITDVNGNYLLNLEPGIHRIIFRSLGKKEHAFTVHIHSSGILNVELEEKINSLKGVEIVAEGTRNVTRLQMGMDRIELRAISEMPSAFGEMDLLKIAQLLPGVQSVGEGASGFNVRGGSTGQNLFLLNGAPLFNTSHFFGFFSAINPDMVSDFSLYKSGIPARYGGRLSSVFDVALKTGNRKEYGLSGGVSPVTGRLLLEGPIVKERSSFIIGSRFTYSDWVLGQINAPSLRNSSAAFQDLNVRINQDLKKNGNLDISAYYSHDRFRLNSDTLYDYANGSVSFSYKQQFRDKLVTSFSAIFSQYRYRISSREEPLFAFELDNRIIHGEARSDLAWYPNKAHKVKFGVGLVYYRLDPGTLQAVGETSLVADHYVEHEKGMEPSFYISDEFRISNRILLYGGLRVSSFLYLGPRTVHLYAEGLPIEPENMTGTKFYEPNEIVSSYWGPEPRISLRYLLDSYSSLKFSYNRMMQYLHMISNTTAVSPTDYWKLSDPYLKPQSGDQFALGYYLDLLGNSLETSVELYYKRMVQIIEYKGGARLVLNDLLETDLINGSGRAYGLELLVRKKGRLNGWASYSYTRIFHTVNGSFPSERINNGEPYPANHDKPHEVSITGNYKISRRFSVSTNFTYSTGRPITYPVSRFMQRDIILLQYSFRNEYRIPDYLRWDLSATLFGNLKSHKLINGDLTLSVYNVTGRDNVYSIYFRSHEGVTKGYSMSVISQPVVSLTYNFRL